MRAPFGTEPRREGGRIRPPPEASAWNRRPDGGMAPTAPVVASARGVERRRDVGDEVRRVLDAGAQPDDSRADVVGAPAGAPLGGRVHAAEGRGLGDELAG